MKETNFTGSIGPVGLNVNQEDYPGGPHGGEKGKPTPEQWQAFILQLMQNIFAFLHPPQQSGPTKPPGK